MAEIEEKVNPFVYYVGNVDRGQDIIDELEKLGGRNPFNRKGDDEDYIYFIDLRGNIDIRKNGEDTWVSTHFKKVELPWKPQDKELVWCWHDRYECGRNLRFYDDENKGVFSMDGKRNSYKFDHYEQYDGRWPKWAMETHRKLEN